MMGLLATIAFFPAVGLAVSRVAGRVQPFLAGAGAAGVLLFVLNLAHVPLAAVIVAIAAASVAALWRVKPQISMPSEPVPTAIMAIVSAWLLFVTAVVPLDDYDGRAFWLLKAKAIAHERQVDGPLFQQTESASPRNQYPLLVPVDAAVTMLAGGGLDDRHVRWLYAGFAIAFALEVRRRLGAWYGAALLCLPQILRAATTASSDLALGAFASAAFFAIVEEAPPIQLGLWLACAVLTKSEGLPLALLLLAAGAFVYRKRVFISAVPFAISTAALLLWRARVHHSDEAHASALVSEHYASAIPKTLAAFAEQFVTFKNWGVLWIAFFVAVAALAIKKEWRILALIAGIVAPMIAFYVAIIAATHFDVAQMDGFASRLLTHLLGPAMFAVAASVQEHAAREVVGEG